LKWSAEYRLFKPLLI